MKQTNWGVPDYEAIANISLEHGCAVPCQICEKRAVVLEFDMPRSTLLISSPLRSFALLCKGLETVIELVQQKRFRILHDSLADYDGLDGYCPQCNAMYCSDHWIYTPNWDDCFYDDTVGCCPKGHSRIVDD